MNHFILPGNPKLDRFNDSAQYGINVMELLINTLMHLGAHLHNLKAKVFGGRHFLQRISDEQSPRPKNAQET